MAHFIAHDRPTHLVELRVGVRGEVQLGEAARRTAGSGSPPMRAWSVSRRSGVIRARSARFLAARPAPRVDQVVRAGSDAAVRSGPTRGSWSAWARSIVIITGPVCRSPTN